MKASPERSFRPHSIRKLISRVGVAIELARLLLIPDTQAVIAGLITKALALPKSPPFPISSGFSRCGAIY